MYALIPNREDHILAFDKDARLVYRDLLSGTERVLGEFPELLPSSVAERPFVVELRLYVHPRLPLVALVQDRGAMGVLVNYETTKILAFLYRQHYHTDQTPFPLAFVLHEGVDYMLHAGDWNYLNISRITADAIETIFIENTDEDYFLGELLVSPDQQWILSKGWRWSPVVEFRAWRLADWLNGNSKGFAEADVRQFAVVSYYWNRPCDWLDGERLVIWYNPKEEDEEDWEDNYVCEKANIRDPQPHLLCWNVANDSIEWALPMDYLAIDRMHEALPDAAIYCQAEQIVVYCPLKGLAVYALRPGESLTEERSRLYAQQQLQIYDRQRQKIYMSSKNSPLKIYQLAE